MAKKGQQANRNDQLVRMLRLLMDLGHRNGRDIYTLAERHGTSTRTIRRDLDALAGAGIPLKRQPGDGSRLRWSLDLDTPHARELLSIATSLNPASSEEEED